MVHRATCCALTTLTVRELADPFDTTIIIPQTADLNTVDICIETPWKELDKPICKLAELLAKSALCPPFASQFRYVQNAHSLIDGMEKVVCVSSAKVPIVKVWDPELELACDMNVNNTLALENTRMIRTYIELDERVRPLAMIIKHWTRRRIINDAGSSNILLVTPRKQKLTLISQLLVAL